jgi:hypothetical protein
MRIPPNNPPDMFPYITQSWRKVYLPDRGPLRSKEVCINLLNSEYGAT